MSNRPSVGALSAPPALRRAHSFPPCARHSAASWSASPAATAPRAEAFAQKHDIPVVFDDYASLLASDEIDAVYNPLPNSLHAEWTIVAAENGKHVFCEKPLAINPAEAQTMVDACKKAGVVFFEAFVFLYHPQTLRLRQVLDSGRIGKLIQVEAHIDANIFRRPNIETNIRLSKELVGGALMDMGCYPITFARFAFGEEPMAVQADCYIHPKYGVDTRDALDPELPRRAHRGLAGQLPQRRRAGRHPLRRAGPHRGGAALPPARSTVASSCTAARRPRRTTSIPACAPSPRPSSTSTTASSTASSPSSRRSTRRARWQ